MSFSRSAPGLDKRIAKSSQDQIEQELFQAADKRIAELNKTGVAQGLTDVSEPKCQHLPVLMDMGDFDGWTHEDLADKGGKTWELETDRRLRRINKELTREKIEVNDILKDVVKQDGSTKKCRHVMLIGPAGSGKTTLLRRIAKHASQGKYEMLKDKLLINADLRTFPVDKKILPSQGLLGSTFSDWESEKMDQRYQCVLNNSEKVGFFVDSLDTLPFDLNSERPPIAFNEPTTPDVILHNLLAKELFPKSFIVSSSREFKVRNMHPTVRPDRCILLNGLEQESVKDLIDGFLGKDKGAEMKKYIDNECPEIWPLLSIPVFLVFSTISFAQDGFKPKTMSGILIKYFLCLIHSPHAQEKEILSVLCKLMPMSFEAICKGQVLFALEDLIQFGLTPDLVRDLTSLIPQSHGTGLSSKLMQKDRFFLCFNHQTQQETLSALHVLSLEMKEFKDFVQLELYVETFGVVRRLVFGILLNDEVLEAAKELTEISDVHQKKIILLGSLCKNLWVAREISDKRKMLEIFIDLAEAREGRVMELIRSSISQIDFEDIILSPSDVHSIAYVTKQLEYLESFDLAGCGLDAKKIKILLRTLFFSNVKVRKINVARNPNIKPFGMFLIGRFARDCAAEIIDLHACNLLMEHLEKFSEGAVDAKLEYLDVSENTRLGSAGMLMLGKLAKHRKVEHLIASRCNSQPNHILKFVEGLENTKLVSLILEESWRKPTFIPELLKLLPHVEQKLGLGGWKICENLRQQLNENCPESLQILLGDEILCRKTSPDLHSSESEYFTIDSGSGSEQDRSALPENYIPLSYIHSREDAKSIEIPIFVSCGDPHITAIILAQKKDDKNWTEMDTTPLNEVENQVVIIQTVEFDFFRIAVLDHRTTFIGSANIYVKGELKHDEFGHFYLKFRPCGEITHEYDDIPGKKKVTFFESKAFRMHDKIEVFLQCVEPQHNFDFSPNSVPFKIDSDFLERGVGETLTVLLDPEPSSRLKMKIEAIVKKNGRDLVTKVFRTSFQGHDGDKEASQPPTYNIQQPTYNIQKIESSIMAKTYAASGSNYQHSEHGNSTTLARHSGSPSPHQQKSLQ